MSNGINELRAAETALCDQEGTLRERLHVAANRFWSAQLDRGFWPEPLRDRADLLNCQLLFAGGIDATVRTMDENTVVIVAGQLMEFIEVAEEILGGDDPEYVGRRAPSPTRADEALRVIW